MTDIGVATRVHMRCDEALIYYRLSRNIYLAHFPYQRRDQDRLLVMAWRSRWSALREIIDAEEQRAKVAADVYDCALCGQRYVRSAVPTSCTVLHSPGSCCHYGEMAA